VSSARPTDDTTPLGILCGGGSIPVAVADAVIKQGRAVVMFPLIGWADPQAMARYAHHWIHVGKVGEFTRLARAAGCREIVLVGTLLRPSLKQVRLDWATVRMFPHIARSFRGGDNHLLSGVARIFERQGFLLRGAHEVAPEILIHEGALGSKAPSARDEADIARGLAVLAATGEFDIGQAAVVANRNIIALEAAEGTDRMLDRVAALRRDGRMRVPEGVGVLVKAAKPNQDHRFDLPAIGPSTVEGVARAGLAGIAIVAGEAIIAEPQQVAKRADDLNVFVAGVRRQP